MTSKTSKDGSSSATPMDAAQSVEHSKGRVTLTRVNAALEAAGYAERLQRGAGCFYFAEGTAELWPRTSVMVSRLSDLSVQDWVEEARDYKEAWDLSMGR